MPRADRGILPDDTIIVRTYAQLSLYLRRFDRACAARLCVIPYRDTVEHGIFATRVPPRPNAIGMSCVKLLAIEGNILRLAEMDILDGTPLLDIKPYVPQYDNYPVKRCGWIDNVPDQPVVADARFEEHRPRGEDGSEESLNLCMPPGALGHPAGMKTG